MRNLKTLVLGLLLTLGSPLAAFAQCSGQAPAATYCGNATGSLALPGWKPMSGFAVDLDVGTTTISNGTSGTLLYNNAGVLGEVSAFLRKANPTNLYVATTGNDSNSCLSGSACLTLQRAINVALGTYDFQGANLTINVGAGSFAGGTVGGHLPGAGGNNALVIKGAGSTSTTISSTIRVVSYANVRIGGMRITVASGSDLLIQESSTVMLDDGDVDFGPAVDALVHATNGSKFLGQSNYGIKISGGALAAFLVQTDSHVQLSASATNTITGTPNFPNGFANVIVNSSFNPGISSTWSGSATGVSYNLSINASVDMEQSLNPLPGTGYGWKDYSSAYYGVPATANSSLFEGTAAGSAVTTGTYNTAFGISALGSVSTTSDSTAMGARAIVSATVQNDAFGSRAGAYITTSPNNLAVGALSLGGQSAVALTGTGNNTAVGYTAMQLLRGTANTNTAVGSQALPALLTGNTNTAVGYNSLSNATGNLNIGIGASNTLSAAADSNSIVIGNSIAGLGSDTINIGGIFKATGTGTPSSSVVTLPGLLQVTGAVTAPSIALGGATIGTNVLASTGQNLFNGANEAGVTTGYYASWSFNTTSMIQRNVTNLNTPKIYSLGVDMQVNNSVAGLDNAGFLTFITTPSGYATNQNSLNAWLAQNIHQGTSTINSQSGMAAASFNLSSGAVTTQTGSVHTASGSGTGAIGTQTGVNSTATSSGASAVTLQTAFTGSRTFSGAATVGTSVGIQINRPTGGASATFTNTYGVYVLNQTPTAGTFTNPTIGVLIDSQTGSGAFGIQQNGSGINRFEGALLSNGATSGIGYTTGAGGTVTQATSKATAVTLNKATGAITMNNAALAAATIVTFVLNNTAVAATDLIMATHESGGTTGAYTVNCRATGAGAAACDVRNNTAGSLSEAIVIRFSVNKSVNT